ncbi:DUF2332 domain-containing protein [Arthrobacter sp. UM1]|uniref:DUF2332 domain-containing protein n=1 Tax=Arthrobacter sp. UM1 TaxID=2766776 RepID=UPI001CF684FE|nr:DUF2332 domain-containing protein [Arthrobacter sp. UM1]MCB4207608.1 DUF2332 domain-containing protein [Arthrobacter sp. UM1]
MTFTPVPESYRRFAETECQDAPVYAAWTRAVAGNAELCERIARLPGPKRQPNLIFAAARIRTPERPDGSFELDSLSPEALVQRLLETWDAIEHTLLTRANQTNEPARSSIHMPLMAELDRPIALIEVGCSAGLTTIPDRYSYRFRTARGTTTADPADGPSPVVLDCDADDDAPEHLPEIVWRGGIDLNPLDLDPSTPRGRDDLAWMKALVWPGHEHRAQRLEKAARLATEQRARGPWTTVTGDLLAELPRLVEQAEREALGAAIVVIHTAVIVYLPDPAEFEALMAGLRDRVEWLSCEGPSVLPGVASRLGERAQAALEPGAFILARNGHPVKQAQSWGYWTRPLPGES